MVDYLKKMEEITKKYYKKTFFFVPLFSLPIIIS